MNIPIRRSWTLIFLITHASRLEGIGLGRERLEAREVMRCHEISTRNFLVSNFKNM